MKKRKGTRHTYGQGSTTTRKDGRHFVRIPSAGIAKTFPKGTSFKDADDWRAKQYAAVANGGVIVNPNMTFHQYVYDEWLPAVSRERTEGTHRHCEAMIRLYVEPVIGPTTRLGSITVKHIEAVMDRAKARGLEASTRHQVLRVVNATFNRAVRWKMLPSNPARGVPYPPVPRKEYTLFTPVEAAEFVSRLAHPMANLFKSYLYGGPRLCEGLGCTWPQVDFARNEITICQQLGLKRGPNGEQVLVPIKTRSGVTSRTFTMSKLLRETMLAQRDQQEREKRAAGKAWQNPLNACFTNATGGIWHPVSVDEAFRNQLVTAGLAYKRMASNPMTPHDMRHTCATLLRIAGVDWKDISHMLGHTTVSYTIDTYSHYTQESGQNLADGVDRAFDPTGRPSLKVVAS